MKKLIFACTLLFSLSALANTCIDDPEDTISRKISTEIPEVVVGAKYPNVNRSFEYIRDHYDSIDKIVLVRGKNASQKMAISIKFNDGSDAVVVFNRHELGQGTMNNVFNSITRITKSKRTVINLDKRALSDIIKSRAVTNLSAKSDYLDQESEIGAKGDLNKCTIELELRASDARVDEFSNGLF